MFRFQIFYVLMSFSVLITPALSTAAEEFPTQLPAKTTTTKAESSTAPQVAVEDSPNPQLMNVYKEELYLLKKNEELKRKAVLEKENLIQNQVRIEKETQEKQVKIERMKAEQVRINSELENLRAEMQDYQKKLDEIKTEYGAAELKHEAFLSSLDEEKNNLTEKKKSYDETIAGFNQRHAATSKAINANLMQIQKLKVEVSNSESSIAAMELKINELQADEAKSQAEWMVVKKQVEEKDSERNVMKANLAEAEKKFQNAAKELKAAEQDLQLADRKLAEAKAKSSVDIKKLEDSMLSAMKNRSLADANRIRTEAEIEKINSYIQLLKQSSEEASFDEKSAEAQLLNKTLALEVARSELAKQTTNLDRANFRREVATLTEKANAAADQANGVLGSGKLWAVTKTCEIRAKPRNSSGSVGEVTVGQRIPASQGPGNWVKILSGGKNAYVQTNCGNFE